MINRKVEAKKQITSQTGALAAMKHRAGETASTATRGLFLKIAPTGANAFWIVRYSHQKRQRARGLGPIDLIPYLDAATKTNEVRALARNGVDYFARTKTAAKVPTFDEFAVEVHERLRPSFKNTKHASQWLTTVKVYANPIIGDLPINAVDQAAVLRVMHQQVTNSRSKASGDFWLITNETANRTLQRIAKVLDVAQSLGLRDSGENPVRVIRAANVLPKPKKASNAHHAALPWKALPAFWSALTERTDTSADALRLLILSGCRTSEVLGAAWTEIDLEAAIWAIPADRMKAGREHVVPLPTQAIELLKARATMRGRSELVFEGQKAARPLSNMALLALLRRMERTDITAHGFRSCMRDWAGDHGVDRVVAEAMLAHTTGNKVEQAYARSQLLERRRPVGQGYADFATGATAETATRIRGAVS